MYETIVVKIENGYEVIQFNQPKNMNALDAKLVEELYDATVVASCDPEVKALVLTGSGKAFCAGGDLHRLSEGFDPQQGYQYMKAIHRWAMEYINIPKPTIAAVNGYAVGAGFCIALMSDIVIANGKAKFGQSFVNVGLLPDLAGMYYLPRLVGLQKAKELIFTGKRESAGENPLLSARKSGSLRN
jgi:2-(1,2-epoxy-1,2-dihydrophenyl)acetyl-CoA isomerase